MSNMMSHFRYLFLLFYMCSFYSCMCPASLFSQNCSTDQWKRVYFATFPRSGNHWVRHLIEEASFIATGCVYPVPQHQLSIFPWKGYPTPNGFHENCRYPKMDESIFISTHFPSLIPFPGDLQPHYKTIRIVRHPVDSIYSYYLLIHHGNPTEKIIPKKTLEMFIAQWKKFQEYWNKDPHVITFRYEDLLNPATLKTALTTMLEILNYQVTEGDIDRAITEFPPNGKSFQHLKKFPIEDVALINSELSDLLFMFGYDLPPAETYP